MARASVAWQPDLMNKVLREALAEAETLSDDAQTALAEQLKRDIELRR